MGEIADGMIDGGICTECGQWLEESAGFPTTCHSCSVSEQGYRQEKKKSNLSWSTNHLMEKGLSFLSKNNGSHLILTRKDGVKIDFWPSTGKYIMRDTKAHGRGVKNLIKHLEGM